MTDYALMACRAILALTFLVAGVAKLVNSRSLLALRDLGIPKFAQPPLLALPWAEIGVGVGLLFALTARYAAWGALGLLALFIVVIAANLVRGRRPSCNCFGQVHRKPISPWTLVRNGVLALAAWLVIQSGPPPESADLWVFVRSLDTHGRMVATMVGIASVIALMFLVREQEEDQTPLAELDMPTFDEMLGKAPVVATSAAASTPRSENTPSEPRTAPVVRYAAPGIVLNGDGLPVGMAAPAFELPDVQGRVHSLASLLAEGKPLLLVFTSPHCESCNALVPKLPALAEPRAGSTRLVLVTRGTPQQVLAKVGDPGSLVLLRQKEYEVAESFNSTTSPDAVLVGVDGTIQGPIAHGGPAILQVIADLT